MDDSSYRLNFDLGKESGTRHHSYKERRRMSKTAKFVVKCGKYSPAKFTNLYIYCITRRKDNHF